MKNMLIAGLLCAFAVNGKAEEKSSVTYLSKDHKLPVLVCGSATGSWFRLDDALRLMKMKLAVVENQFRGTDLIISSPTVAYGGVTAIMSTACVLVSEKS